MFMCVIQQTTLHVRSNYEPRTCFEILMHALYLWIVQNDPVFFSLS